MSLHVLIVKSGPGLKFTLLNLSPQRAKFLASDDHVAGLTRSCVMCNQICVDVSVEAGDACVRRSPAADSQGYSLSLRLRYNQLIDSSHLTQHGFAFLGRRPQSKYGV